MGGYVLGVDLGTTWTAAAIARGGERPEMVALGGRATAVPTIVGLQPEGWFAVGDAAARRAAADPDRTGREFKRRIGDTTPVLLGGAPYSPESLLATVLWWVVAQVTEREGGGPDAVVVTHPANWGPLRRELLEQAVRQAGMSATFATEPEAAAVHYAAAERVPDGTVVAVYDLGGGTFDASILRKTPSGFEALGRPSGVERLGGLDFDAAVLAHVTGQLGAAWTQLDPDDPTVRSGVARLRDDCIAAKEALSEDPAATVPVHLPTIATEVRLTRPELEGMIRASIELSADVLGQTIRDAGLEPAAIDRILLVGGSSRIPLVAQVLTARFGRPLAVDTHPKHAVALGAARLAATRLSGGAPAPTVASTAVAPAVGPVVAPAPEPVVVAAAPPPGGSKAPLLIGLGVVVLLAIVVGLVLSSGGADDEVADRNPIVVTTTTTEPVESTTTTTLIIDEPAEPEGDLGAAALDGEWFFEGEEVACDGLAEADCAQFESSFASDITITCFPETDRPCEVVVAASPAAELLDQRGGDGSQFFAGGRLAATDGFACDGAADPTEWTLGIDGFDVGDDGGAVAFGGTVTFTSQDGAIDGNSCVFEQVVARGAATRQG